ncbi:MULTISPECIES: trypsin-like serine protease [unclassified Corynebacterium]|uniref:trypsin-like serine protease n=1 Tax=unclassified Corynebacterium TaxID=2624378 RepID=UPI0029CA5ABE|nr:MULTISPECIES: trypsin-like serine protease [unclassified Corynebacterium]WPF66857.1 trypsin-like peptidase domain-containing protein [Corynebacterium sp. 22KM0430]WPF69345.1 trypsin-like peptidase domain-containing protein [Corynebacterium sp. 21KM1197]
MGAALLSKEKRTSRTAGLVAALAVALTPLATAATAQAAVPLRQGAAIEANGGGGCALSIADTSTAYTALHCGDGEWQVGDEIKSRTGRTVGTISALGSDLPEDKQLDVAKIDLVPGVQINGAYAGAGDSAALKNGDRVTFYAPGNRGEGVMVNVTPKRMTLGNDGKFPSFLFTADIQTFGGNSGGALLNSQDELVGVLAGGNRKDRSDYTPINVIRELLG